MSIFGNIMNAIFGKKAEAAGTADSTATVATPSAPAVSTAPTSSSTPAAAPAGGGQVDVAAILDAAAKAKKQKLNWRTSIVDLMKLLDRDSSSAVRKELAKELNYTGDPKDSAKMNI